MWKSIPWAIAVIALIAFGASFSELQRMRTRFGEVTSHNYRDHAEVREFMIRAALADTPQPIVFLGDSITEMAPLPQRIGEHPIINAGIGGQTIKEARRLAMRVLDERVAFMIVLAVGANDAGSASVRRDFADLIDAVKPLSSRPQLAVAVAPDIHTNREIEAAAASHAVEFISPPLPVGSNITLPLDMGYGFRHLWLQYLNDRHWIASSPDTETLQQQALAIPVKFRVSLAIAQGVDVQSASFAASSGNV